MALITAAQRELRPEEAARLLEALRPAFATALPAVSDLAHLPLVEIRAAKPGPFFAVIYSGDGGWRDLDKTLGELLATQGVSTVGVDSLRYFWHQKSPEQVASDLATILAVYRSRFGAERVLLIGYSFGADILPFAFNRLPADDQARVVQITLLGLGSHAAFEFHLSNWVPGPDTEGPLVLPELLRMDLARLQCVYGSEEEDTLCPLPELKGVEVIRTQGGHHFDGDYRALGQRILDGARRRLAADPIAPGAQRATTPTTPPEISEATSVSTKASAKPPGAAR
jgi:type IV secretory pathway VirJ component